MSDPARPHKRQPTRLPHPWDSPGKNTGVGCHFLLQCMKMKSERSRSVVSDCSNPMDCSPPGPSVHGIFQAKVLEWGAIAFSVLDAWKPLNLGRLGQLVTVKVFHALSKPSWRGGSTILPLHPHLFKDIVLDEGTFLSNRIQGKL